MPDYFAHPSSCQGASIGANATIVCGVTLGRYCFVGAGGVVTRDVPDYALGYGSPARIHGRMCQCGVQIEFSPSCGDDKAICPVCGDGYLKNNSVVVPIGEPK